MTRVQDARHVCRKCNGMFSVEPQRNAHRLMHEHFKEVHGLRMPTDCTHECGFRATPYEGRYTKTYQA